MRRWYLQNTREAAQPSLFVAWESGGESADGDAPEKGLVLYVNPELHLACSPKTDPGAMRFKRREAPQNSHEKKTTHT